MTEPLSTKLDAAVKNAEARLREHPDASAVLTGQASASALAAYYVTTREAVAEADKFLRQSHEQLARDAGPEALIELLAAKAVEESGHHHWLTEDLAALGYPPTSAATPVPGPAAAAYNAFHRTLIPISGMGFLGTAYVLESLAVRCAGKAADNLRKSGRIPGLAPGSDRGVRFFTSHSAEDVGHVSALASALDQHVTRASDRAYILLCARFTATVYPDFFRPSGSPPAGRSPQDPRPNV